MDKKTHRANVVILLALAVVIVLTMLAMSGCSTVSGIGQDLQAASEAGRSALIRFAEE